MATPTHGYYSPFEVQKGAYANFQRKIIIHEAPATDQGAVGQELAGRTVVEGTYYCRVECAGITALKLHLLADIAAGTVTSSGNTCHMFPYNATNASLLAAPYLYQAITGVGALVDDTTQALTVTLVGEQFLILKLVVSAGGSATFSLAEYNGLHS